MKVSASLTSRDTPAGRAFEAKIILFDCLMLIPGCAGLALSFPPLVYLAAVGHITASFFQAPVKWLWPVLEAITLGITSTAFFGALYLVQVFYYGSPSSDVVADLVKLWPHHLAVVIVVSGIMSNLLSLPGITDQLVEMKNREGDHTAP